MSNAYGIDVSSFQAPNADRPNIDFTIVKATEGTGYVNPNHTEQVATARAAGHVVGHYHFLHPGNIQAQVAWFWQHISEQPGDILAVDWETCEDGSAASSAEKDEFLQLLADVAPGHRVVLYCNRDFWVDRDTSGHAGDGLWIADPNSPAGLPAIKSPWRFHQYTASTDPDLDIYNGTADQLRAWAGGVAPAQAGPAYPGEQLRVTTPEMHDGNVSTWQQQMAHRGWSITADGWYGPASENTCRQFQQDSTAHGWPLTVDGIVGPQTWAATWARPVS